MWGRGSREQGTKAQGNEPAETIVKYQLRCVEEMERKVLGCRFRYHWLLGGQKSLNHFWTGLRGVLQSEVEWRRVGCVYSRCHVRIGIIMHLR